MSNFMDLVRKANSDTEGMKKNRHDWEGSQKSGDFSSLIRRANSDEARSQLRMNQNSVNNWFRNMDSASRRYRDYYSAPGYKAPGNRDLDEFNRLLGWSDEVRRYMNMNGAQEDQMKGFDEYVSQLRSMQNSGQQSDRYFSQFDSKESYDAAMEAAEEEKRNPYDPERERQSMNELQRRLSILKRQNNQRWAMAHGGSLEKISQEIADIEKQLGEKKDRYVERENWKSIDSMDMETRKKFDRWVALSAAPAANPHMSGARNPVKDEKRGLEQWFTERGYDLGEMKNLRETAERRYNAEMAQKHAQEMEQFAKESPFLANIARPFMSVAGNVASFGQAVKDLGGSQQYSKPDYNAPGYRLSDAAAQIQGVTRQNIEDSWAGKVGSVLYGATTSAADSLMGIATMGPQGYLVYAGMGSGAAATRDAFERGASPAQAFGMGVVSGALEALTEKYSVENLMNITDALSLKNILKQGVAEASEEELNFAGGIIADAIIMGQSSEAKQAMAKYMAQGMSSKEARETVYKELAWEAVNVAVESALSGGIMGGVAGIRNSAENYRLGSKAKASGVTSKRLKELAMELPEDSESRRMAESLDEKAGSQATGKVLKAIVSDSSNANASEISTYLKSKGMPAEDADAIGDIFSDVGEKFTEEQQKAVESDPLVSEAVTEVILNPNSATYKRTDGINSLLMDVAKGKAKKQKTPMAEENAEQVKNPDQPDSEYGEDITEESKPIGINEYVDDMAQRIGMDNSTKEILKGAYNPSDDAETYAKGVENAFTLGSLNIPFREMKNPKLPSSTLSQRQMSIAYKLGQTFGGKQTAKKQASIVPYKRGNVEYNFDRSKHKLNERQKASIEGIERISNALGIKIRLFASPINDKGQHIGKNGSFNATDGSIDLDIYAGFNGDGTILYTAGHELTHAIKKSSPKDFKILANFLNKEYGKEGLSVTDAVLRQMQKAKESKEYSRELTFEQAYEEFVADSMEAMLGDGRVIEKLEKLKAESPSLWQKIKNYITTLADKIRKLYKGLNPDSYEGRFVASASDRLQKLQDLFTEGLVNASSRYTEEAQKIVKDLPEKQEFSLSDRVEKTPDLIAVHNLSEEKLIKSLKLGGLPMPSIAIVKASHGHEKFSDISLVFGKDTIDPKKSKSNEIYSGDAWTPTYPTVSYKASGEAEKRIYKKYKDLSQKYGYDETRALQIYANDLQDSLNRRGGENGVLEDLYNDTRMMQLYRLDAGMDKVPDVVHRTERKMDESVVELSKFLIDELGADLFLTMNSGEGTPITRKRKFIEDHKEEIKGAWEKYLSEDPSIGKELASELAEKTTTAELLKFAVNARSYAKNGGVQIDEQTIPGDIKGQTNQNDYRKWVDSLFKGSVEKEGIRNKKDVFTPSGNRRSWDALHYEHNLENVVKAMKETGKQGIGIFGGNILGASATKYKSIDEVKAEEGRLNQMSDEEISDARKELAERFHRLAYDVVVHKDSFTASDQAANMMVEAIMKYKTKSGISDYLQSEGDGWTNITEEDVDELIDIVRTIRNMPTPYFEAKPRRSVGFEEVAAVVAPESISEDTKKKLNDIGAQIITYKKGDAESRKKALNSIEGVKFSDRDSDGNTLSPQQQEFFKDSKVRDRDGRLRVMYHGTNTGEFYKFDKNMTGNSNDAGYFGDGFYFAFTKGEARFYGSRVIDAYLNIKNPFMYIETFYGTGENKNSHDLSFYEKLPDVLPKLSNKATVEIVRDGSDEYKTVPASYIVKLVKKIAQSDDLTFSEVEDDYSRSGKSNAYFYKGQEVFKTAYENDKPDGRYEAALEVLKNEWWDDEKQEYTQKKFDIIDIPSPTSFILDNAKDFSEELKENGYDGVLQSAEGDEAVAFYPNQIKSTSNDNPTQDPDIRYSERVSDPEKLKFLNSQDTITVYKTMQLVDGKLYPPMGARVNGNYEDYSVLGEWEESIEHPELATKDGKFKLDKGKGEGSLLAAYNPYMHASNLVLNDQFTGAYKRPNLVTIEAVVPVSELSSGYHAKNAKDSVGWHPWHTGTVAGAIRKAKGLERKVFLSRWIKPVRIVPDSEVAQMYKEALSGTDVAVPDNVVPPNLLEELKKAGVKIQESGRIKFSDRQENKMDAALRKENEKLKASITDLKELLKIQKEVTNGTKFTKSSVEIMAGHIRNKFNSSADKTGLTIALNGLYEYIAEGNELTWESLKENAQPIVDAIYKEIKHNRSAYAEDILKQISGTRISMSDSQKKEAARVYGNYNNYRKRLMGRVYFTDSANLTLDEFWKEMSEYYPNEFPEDTNAEDMPIALLDTIDSLKDMDETTDFDYDPYEIKQDIFREIYDGFWKVSTLRTVADVKQKEINALKEKHFAQMEKIKIASKEKLDAVRKERNEALKAASEKLRSNADENLKKVKKKYEESRAKAAERKKSTIERNRIKKTVKELEKILLRGNKKRNVKEGMTDYVSQALATAKLISEPEITDEAVIKYGSFDGASEKERELLDKVSEVDSEMGRLNDLAIKISKGEPVEGVTFKSISESMDSLRKQHRSLLRKLKPAIEAEKARANRATVRGAINQLAEAYRSLKDSEDEYISGAYRDYVNTYLHSIAEQLSGNTLSKMTLNELEYVSKAYKLVLESIRSANKIFYEGRSAELSDIVYQVQSQLAKSKRDMKDSTDLRAKSANALSNFTWNMLSPVDAFQRLGSKAFTDLYWEIINGQSAYGRMAEDVAKFIEESRKKSGYKNFDLLTATPFKLESGRIMKLSLEDMMSVYAYSKREQAHDHMTEGGFVFDTGSTYTEKKHGVAYRHKKLTTPYRLTDLDISRILSEFTEKHQNAKQYVDEVQKYLTDFGKYGNEASRKLYGIDIFNEKNYFPLQSEKDYRSSTEQTLQGTPTTASLAGIGMAKQTVPHAKNPIVLRGFDSVVLEHLDKMAKYSSYLIPIENIRKVFDASRQQGDEEAVSTKAFIASIFGEDAKNYFSQYITDLNGGTSESGAANPLIKLFSRAKKVQVLANLSVVIQQISAVARANSEIKAKYFRPKQVTKANADGLYAEMQKYAPVTVIKEMGGFDVGSNKGFVNFVGNTEAPFSFKSAQKKADDILGWAPEMMDKVGWTIVWKAVKNEAAIESGLDINSEEFLKYCGKRFTEVITKTQVYDSVNSRSGFMRSKKDSVQYLTSFMGEPTRIVGMAFTAANDLRRAISQKEGIKEARAKALRTAKALVISSVLNNMLVAIVYAMRDDDEGEAYWEKWAKHFGEKMRSDLNPFTYLPVFRDIVSIFEGWDIERPDIALIDDLVTAGNKFREELSEGGVSTDTWLKLAGNLGNIFGIPIKNIIRDSKAVLNTFKLATDDIHPDFFLKEFASGFMNKSDKDMLRDALVSEDREFIQRVKESSESEQKFSNKVKTVTKDAFLDGDISRSEAEKILETYCGKDTDEAYWMAQQWASGSEDSSKYANLLRAAKNGSGFQAAMRELTAHGTTEKEALSRVKTEIGSWYQERKITKQQALRKLTQYVGMEKEDAEKLLNKWSSYVVTGTQYDEIAEEYQSGKIRKARAVEMRMKYGGYSREEAESWVRYLDLDKKYPKLELTQDLSDSWYKHGQPAGISVKEYADFKKEIADIHSTDDYPRRDHVMDIIYGMNLSNSQKDALYYAAGYKESTIYKAPWH